MIFLKHIQYLAPPTPLTGRKYLRSKDMSNITPVTTATQSVIKLQALIAGQSAPSEGLLQMLNNCSQDVKSSVEAKVKQIGEQFCANYNNNVNDGSTSDFGKKRLVMGQTLFYKLLEMILNDEKRKKPNDDITVSLYKLRIYREIIAAAHVYILVLICYRISF